MTFRLALRRLLPLLAVISLALTRMTAPAAIAGMHASVAQEYSTRTMDDHRMGGESVDHAAMGHDAAAGMAGMDMDDMPCCPKAEAAKPDCAKGCPLMALCLASVASLLPVAIPVPVPVSTRTRVSWPAPAALASVHGTPLREPPRA